MDVLGIENRNAAERKRTTIQGEERTDLYRTLSNLQ